MAGQEEKSVDERILYPYALLDDTEERISIDEAAHLTGKHKYYCQDCGQPMYPTFGEIQAPHFRHKGKPCKPDHHLHTEAEYTFYEEYNYCLKNKTPFYLDIELIRPCNKACVLKQDYNCPERITRRRVDLTRIFTTASIEQNITIDGRTRRPDVLLTTASGLRLWVEIWVSHTDESKKQDDNILEIKIDGEDDLKPLKEHKVDAFSGKASCFIKDHKLLQAFLDDGPEIKEPVYPCDRYYYWEVYQTPTKKMLFREFSDEFPEKRPGTLFLLVLMLNWSKAHDVRLDIKYPSEKLEMGRVLWFCENKLLSRLPNAPDFMDYSLEILRKYDYAVEDFFLTDEELNDMLGDLDKDL
ncbi:MAG: hypothetical protein J6X25_04805 [Bacteroidales bacterium]|nr:hypothetical protein [Bacteroidales bacterium]